MSKGGRDHFERFEDHTLLKHLILEKYLKAWAFKLLRWGEQVWFVDAFAGEGGDKAGHPGSPVIAGRIAEELLKEKAGSMPGKAPMRVLAVEIDPRRCEELAKLMRPYTDSKPRLADVRQGTLHALIDRFVEHVGGAPVLYFLDPFGVDGLVTEDLPKLLAGDKNEVFALFSDVGAKRLHAVLMSEGRDVNFEVAEVFAAPSLFPEFTEENAESKRREAERSNAALRATQQPAERILADALGPDAVEVIRDVPDAERRQALVRLFMRRLLEAGATYVISMPVRGAANARVYQLVHASKSPVALRTMKETMSQALGKSTLPDDTRTAIRAELRLDVTEIVREIANRFAGRSVHWSEGKDRSDDSIRRFLLEATPVFPWQLDEIKQALVGEGFEEQRRPQVFRFP